MKTYDSNEEAIADGRSEESLRTLSWRNDEERDAILLAAQHGNRDRRRDHHNPRSGYGDPTPISKAERNKRNAKRRKAKAARKRS